MRPSPLSRLARRIRSLSILVAAAGLSAAAVAQPTPGDITIDLQPAAVGLVCPILGVPCPDNSGRLFIVDQTGKILILQNGVVLPTPFLDLAATGDLAPLNAQYDEKGLLGLAFHPNYATNGRFFVRYSKQRVGDPSEPCFSDPRGCHEEILAEYHVSTNPNIANPTGSILFRVNKPEFNHNSGEVDFGPDGYLYFTLGDGGGANDDLNLPSLPHGPIGNAQNTNVFLGKVHRIDVNGAAPYTIPPTNPFAISGGRPEIWAYGLRNPFRFSFDNGPGGDNRMWLTDVGQDETEELNIGQIGANYGWAVMEGPHCFDPFHTTTPPPTCNNAGMTMPIASYEHADGGIAIIGGFVYRGTAVPQLRGMYVFGDFTRSFAAPLGTLYYIDPAAPSQIRILNIGQEHRSLGLFLKGFGRDQDGEIYVMGSGALGPTGTRGEVMRIIACYANCDNSAGTPSLNANDFQCFMNKFANGDPAANCDLSVTPPILNVNDFQCFLNKFAAQCP
jgi:glucose/arabinose dehydrogenase